MPTLQWPTLPGKRALEAEDVEGTIILAAWLRSRGERDGFVFRLSEEAPVAAQLGEWSAALESIVSRTGNYATSPSLELGPQRPQMEPVEIPSP